METKFIKVKCNKTNKYFALETVNKGGSYEIVNFVDLSDDDAKIICTEVRPSQLTVAKNLLPCSACGSRKFASCSCAKRNRRCQKSDKYNYQCVFCDELTVDYSRNFSGPYTEWAGVSNIPAAAKDRFGNPQGGQYDLAQDGSFKGYTIIVLQLYSFDFSSACKALNKKGFDVKLYSSVPSEQQLASLLDTPNSQLWVISDSSSKMTDGQARIIREYFNRGYGVYIWGDNDPFYADANKLLKTMFNTSMSGNLPGDKVISVQQRTGEPGIIANHPITTGIVNFYEGITIATVSTGQILSPLVYGSARNIVTAFYDRDGKRALVDGGFTRLYYKWDSAGTDRYVVNAAAWLANIERFGYNPQ